MGFDIVELCPNEVDKSSDFLAAKLYYKMLSYKFQSDESEDTYEVNYLESNRLENHIKFNDDQY